MANQDNQVDLIDFLARLAPQVEQRRIELETLESESLARHAQAQQMINTANTMQDAIQAREDAVKKGEADLKVVRAALFEREQALAAKERDLNDRYKSVRSIFNQ